MSPEELQEIKDRLQKATPGPWTIWEGPQFEGGGADLCIGAGREKWLANMDHRHCGKLHNWCDTKEMCDICSIDSVDVTDEQRANAEFIANSRQDVEKLLKYIELLERELDGFVNGSL